MMKKYCPYFLLLFMLLPLWSFGQDEEKVVIAGRVIDADSLQVLPSVHVRVRNTRLGGVTASDGRFRIRVNLQDSLVFSSVGYQPFMLIPADSTAESLAKLTIRMKPQITVLDEVRFKEYIDITKYIRREYDTTVDLRRSKGTPMFEDTAPAERRAVGLTGGENGAALEGAVTAFANLFSSEFQQKKKLEEIMKVEEEQKKNQSLRERMTQKYEAMVSVVAELTAADLHRFTDTYMPSPFTMVNMSDYAVIEGIVLNLKKFDPEKDPLKKLLENGKFEGQEGVPQQLNPPGQP